MMTMSRADFTYIAELVRRGSAIVLEPGKEYLVESRLLPVARDAGADTIAGLVQQLRRVPDNVLHDQVVEAMTTNETSFFRDVHPFTALADTVLPELVEARGAHRQIDVWCAAASSGQEPYSVAMLLDELLGDEPGWRLRVLASDLSQRMLDRTELGVYSQLEVNRGLPVQRLLRHFEREGHQWRAKGNLRAMIRTQALNLDGPWPAIPPMDVVLLRNVLIYFDVPTKQRVLARVREVLRPDGYLFLGGAETTLGLDDSYERVQVGRVPAYRLRAELTSSTRSSA
jgi:chemotaxis protein methyltransferase CheR